MRKILIYTVALWGGLALGTACSSDDELNQEPVAYEGPLFEADSIQLLYSDSAIVRVKLEAPKRYEFENGDSEYPQGIYIEFFEPDGSISSTLLADHAFHFREENRYTAIGNVEVEGHKENNKLLTDTLHWSTAEQQVYTKAFVTIIEDADTLKGQGLEAAQDFSSYTILKPVGTTMLDGDSEDETATDEDN